MYSAISSAVDIRQRPLVQVPFSISCLTDSPFRQASLYKFGARSLGAWPRTQEEFQNWALAPSPTVTMVLHLNNCWSISEQGTTEPTQGLSGSTHVYQSHRNLRALLNFSKSRTPKPPLILGRFTLSQTTKHWAPFASAVPFHRKARLILSIFFKAHFFRSKTVRK